MLEKEEEKKKDDDDDERFLFSPNFFVNESAERSSGASSLIDGFGPLERVSRVKIAVLGIAVLAWARRTPVQAPRSFRSLQVFETISKMLYPMQR